MQLFNYLFIHFILMLIICSCSPAPRYNSESSKIKSYASSGADVSKKKAKKNNFDKSKTIYRGVSSYYGPNFHGKLTANAIRVPTPNVSLIDLTFVPNKEVTSESINDAMSKAANGPLKGILATNSAPLVSKDFNHNPHSSIFDLTQTQVIKGKFSRVLSWYDNEWGFSNRMCDTAMQIASLI